HLLSRYGKALFFADWRGGAVEILEEASHLLLAAGEVEEAAAAEVTLGIVHWYRVERDRAAPHFELAAELIEGAAPSRVKAEVLTELGRFAVLGDEDAKGPDLARPALTMPKESGPATSRARV